MVALKVGIIGCGAIGSVLARSIDEGKLGNRVKIVSLYDISFEKAKRLSDTLKTKVFVAKSFEEFVSIRDLELIVEAASQRAVKEYGVKVLEHRKDLMVMSVGALLDEDLLRALTETAERYGRKIYVPSGAVAGIDGLRAANLGSIEKVVHIVRKNPKTLQLSEYAKEKGIRLSGIKESITIYEGPAYEAIKLFPRNVNVSATISLAGIGAEHTIVRVIADPKINRNVHELIVKGSFGEIKVVMSNVTHPENPRTSFIAALSALETIRRIASNINIGT